MTEKKIPRGIRNNNPLNIRKGNNWIGERKNQVDPAFEEFQSVEYGLRAGFILLRKYMATPANGGYGCNTIQKIVHRWAPPSENITNKYVDYVAGAVGIDSRQRIDFTDKKTLCRIVQAMCFVENGSSVDFSVIQSAYELV